MTMKGSFKIKNYADRATLIVVTLFVILFAVFGSLFGPSFRNIFVPFIGPLDSGEYALLPREVLVARLSDAERELSRIRYQAVLYTLTAEENTRLRDAANTVQASGGVTARVISRPPRTVYDSLLIDAGLNQAVLPGNLVVFENIALGRVLSATDRSAVVQLFSSPGSLEDAVVGNPVAVASARGLGGGAFELSIPQSVTIQAGDTVRLPGSESYVLGIVAAITFEATDVSKTVRFSGAVSLADLDFVRVITDTPQ